MSNLSPLYKTMNSKILFLDFDGVLITHESEPARLPLGLGKNEMRSLKKILAAVNCKIVVTSTFRVGKPIVWFRELFGAYNIEPERVLDSTPVIKDAKRGVEIDAWLKSHTKVRNFVILDDTADLGMHEDRLIRVDFNVGLTSADADKAIKMFGQAWSGRNSHN